LTLCLVRADGQAVPTITERRPNVASHRADARLARRLGVAALVAAVVAIPFALLLMLVAAHTSVLIDIDTSVAERLHGWVRGSDAAVTALHVIDVVTAPVVFQVTVAATCVWLWVRRDARRLVLWAVVTMATGGLLGVALKLLVSRARPVLPDPLEAENGYSFPSGHALNSMLGAAVLLLIALPLLRRAAARVAAWAAACFVVLITGLDRILLGAHYLSDVIAAWSIGLAVVAATATAFEVWRREQGRPPSASPAEGVEPEVGE
jgi:undecaprenyl-diphosphatase